MTDACAPGWAGYPSDCEVAQGLRERARAWESLEVPRSPAWQASLAKARSVELLLLDVDGVLTDGTLTYTHDGGENKRFHTQDGFGLRMLREQGILLGLITARTSVAVTRRAADLGIQHVVQGRGDKAAVLEEILAATGLRPFQTAAMGDDWLDVPLLRRVGFSAAPANAVAEVRLGVDYVTERSGGAGAVRELCDLLLEARGLRPALLQRYLMA
jgi:3-deoxy-D-manno-octulosonate 8-phosphate phosphatase (KDO 8-P phosphatase)